MESGEIRELPEDLWQGEEGSGHGRKERREVRTVTDLEWLENKTTWQDVRTLVQYGFLVSGFVYRVNADALIFLDIFFWTIDKFSVFWYNVFMLVGSRLI
jgi:hypothetical protein